jgi:hypothetical protein
MIANPPREAPTRKCDVCGEQMQHLGDLPAIATKPVMRVFRCYHCNHVKSERVTSVEVMRLPDANQTSGDQD